MLDLMHAASQSVATVDEIGGDRNLLTVHEVADLLQVRVSWVYERTRRHGPEQLPHLKIGKYLRFEERALTDFIQR
jgi:excisionase family DNA binding protein